MTIKEIADMLASLGFPVTYYEWKNGAPALPYIAYFYDGRDDEFADGKNWAAVANLVIELYTDEKDFDLEKKLEKLLNEHDIAFNKEEQFLQDDDMYETQYTSEVILEN